MNKKMPEEEKNKPVPVCLKAAYRAKALELGGGNLSAGVRVALDAYRDKSSRAHEIWAAAQLMPGESIRDGILRIAAILTGK